jgi:hypothetical protein
MTAFPDPIKYTFIAVPRQLTLDFVDVGVEDPPRTELTYKGTSQELGINVYTALHEFIVNETGRAYNVTFTRYIKTRQFPVYYHRGLKLLLIKTNKDVAQSAMKQLVRVAGISGERRRIDLESIKAHINRFTGGWWRVEDSSNVRSQALFGSSIDRDQRFDRASAEGKMFNVRFDHDYQSEIFHIGVSDDCNIVIYNEGLSTQLEIELVLDIKAKLLDIAIEKQ